MHIVEKEHPYCIDTATSPSLATFRSRHRQTEFRKRCRCKDIRRPGCHDTQRFWKDRTFGDQSVFCLSCRSTVLGISDMDLQSSLDHHSQQLTMIIWSACNGTRRLFLSVSEGPDSSHGLSRKPIHRTSHTMTSLVQDVGLLHCRHPILLRL